MYSWTWKRSGRYITHTTSEKHETCMYALILRQKFTFCGQLEVRNCLHSRWSAWHNLIRNFNRFSIVAGLYCGNKCGCQLAYNVTSRHLYLDNVGWFIFECMHVLRSPLKFLCAFVWYFSLTQMLFCLFYIAETEIFVNVLLKQM